MGPRGRGKRAKCVPASQLPQMVMPIMPQAIAFPPAGIAMVPPQPGRFPIPQSVTSPPLLASSPMATSKDWVKAREVARMLLVPHERVPLARDSLEYSVIEEYSCSPNAIIHSIDRVVNPRLLSKFESCRRELISAKSNDAAVLKDLGLSDEDIAFRLHGALNYADNALNAALGGIPYHDHVALLFHCTRSRVETVFDEGLDHRLGKGGLCGRGIYFADNPVKSMGYDTNSTLLLFGVYLGDCCSVHQAGQGSLVREPAKSANQKRLGNDQFFDSIVSRPSNANEFVIFNPDLCVPLYAVKYGPGSGATNTEMAKHQACIPSFAWDNPNASTMSSSNWPFMLQSVLAQTQRVDAARLVVEPIAQPRISEQDRAAHIKTLVAMGFNSTRARQALNESNGDMTIALDLLFAAPSSPPIVVRGRSVDREDDNVVVCERNAMVASLSSAPGNDDALRHLAAMGFSQVPTCIDALERYDGDIKRAIEFLLAAADEVAHDDVIDGQGAKRSAGVPDDDRDNCDNEEDTQIMSPECPICCERCDMWRQMKCRCQVCAACYTRMVKKSTTMSGQAVSFIICPFCRKVDGIQVGDCPKGTMHVAAPDRSGFIAITYTITQAPFQCTRQAFVPDSAEARPIIDRLRIAWDRRLIFGVGESLTTGRHGVIWAIHHKTSRRGGVACHGFPDPGYLSRVADELTERGC